MRETNTDRHQKRWFDNNSAQKQLRDGLQLLFRALLLSIPVGCF